MPSHDGSSRPRFAQSVQPIQVHGHVHFRVVRGFRFGGRTTFPVFLRRRWSLGRIAAICLIGFGTGLPTGTASALAQSEPVAWHTGDAWQRALQRPVDLAWSQRQLRSGLRNLAESQRVAIFLSCRVNPNQRIDFSSSGQTLEATLRELAESRGLGIGWIGPVVFLGRPAVAAELATSVELHRQKLRELPTRQRAKLRRRVLLGWESLAEPSELIQQINVRLGIDVGNLAQIPYDLWPAYELPELDYCEQMTLLLAGFDRSFELGPEATTCTLRPLARRLAMQRSYPAGTRAAALAEEIKRSFPTVKTTRHTHRLVVEGRWEDHRAIRKLLGRGTDPELPANGTPAPASALKRFQLTIQEQPVGRLLDHLAAQMALEIKYSAASRPHLENRVSVAVQDLTRQQLFDAIAEQAGLTAEIREETVWIEVRPSPRSR